MAASSSHPKAETFNFRIDPVLKAAFVAATETVDRPAAQVLRDFMRAYVRRQERRVFEAEAHRQSLILAERSRDTTTDEYASLQELEALFDQYAGEDSF